MFARDSVSQLLNFRNKGTLPHDNYLEFRGGIGEHVLQHNQDKIPGLASPTISRDSAQTERGLTSAAESLLALLNIQPFASKAYPPIPFSSHYGIIFGSTAKMPPKRKAASSMSFCLLKSLANLY